MVSNNFRKQATCMILGLFIGFFLISSCQTHPLTSPSFSTETPKLVITVLNAQLVGKLEMVDGCLRVESMSGTSFALAWTPNLKATVGKDHVRVEIGILQKRKREVDLYFGKSVSLGGGGTPLDEQTRKSLPAYCLGPYWVVGDIE